MSKLLSNYYFKIIIVALFIRLLIIPFTFHPDIKTYHFQSSQLSKGVFNIYDFLDNNKEKLPLKDGFVYFPLTYFFLGGYQIIASPILGSDFNSWLYDASQSSVENNQIFRYLTILKFPYLLFDFAIAFLLLKLFKDEKEKRKAFMFWLLNPFSIIMIYLYSNVDIIPVFLTILTLFTAYKERYLISALLLGIAAGFKAYPLLLLPFVSLLPLKLWKKIFVFSAGLLVLIAIIAPFYSSQSFQQSALVSGLTTRIVSFGFSLGFGELILPAIAGIAVLFFYALTEVTYVKENLWKYFLAVFLIVFSFVHYHIQWLLWMMPFLVILAVKRPRLISLIIILLIISFLIPFLYEDKFMTFALFGPINYLFTQIPAPATLINRIYDPVSLQGILHSIFAGGSLLLVWKIFKEK